MKNLKIYWSCLAFTVLLSGFAVAADEQGHKQPTWVAERVKLAATAAKIINLEISVDDIQLHEEADKQSVNKLQKLLTWYKPVVEMQSEILMNSKNDRFRIAGLIYVPLSIWQIVTSDYIELVLYGAPAAYAAYMALDKGNQDKYAAHLRKEIGDLDFEQLMTMVEGSENTFTKIVKLAYAAYAKAHGLAIPDDCNATSNTEEEFELWQNTSWYRKLLPGDASLHRVATMRNQVIELYQWALTKKANKAHRQ